jgi:predicted DNA-binding transcriptional regulator AlpA
MSHSAMRSRDGVLSHSLVPRGLRRTEAAAYIGVSPTLFDRMIAEGLMPRPKRVAGRVIWDRVLLDEAFAAIPSDDEAPPKRAGGDFWDEVT